MLRVEIEQMMKARGMKSITIVPEGRDNGTSTVGISCDLKGDYLYDYTNHRVNRKINIVAYIDYDGQGNADMIRFATNERVPILRKGYRVCYQNQEEKR